MLRGADQLQYLQHLLYLLPPCNCDTLLRLLSLLHTVQRFAQDAIGTNDEEVGEHQRSLDILTMSHANIHLKYLILKGERCTMGNVVVCLWGWS